MRTEGIAKSGREGEAKNQSGLMNLVFSAGRNYGSRQSYERIKKFLPIGITGFC